jgi:uncharacterized protein (DUF362 family)
MSIAKEKDGLTRRRFITRSAKAGLSIAAACALGYWRYDSSGPAAKVPDAASAEIPVYAVPEPGPAMAIAEGTDRKMMLRAGLEALGGISAFIRRGERVVLKVNAAFASPPSLGATTHPALVAEMVRLCLDAGAASVTVTDNPINDPASCFRLTGIESAVRAEGGKVVLPVESHFRPLSSDKGRLLNDWPVLYAPLENADKLIGMAPVKDHHRSGASMTMKNWYGLLGGQRNILHQDIHTTIMELAMMVTPTLVVLDGTDTMMQNGPTGGSLSDLKRTGKMVLSTDQVAADAFGATLLERRVGDLPFIARAAAAGLGTADWESLRPVRLSIG